MPVSIIVSPFLTVWSCLLSLYFDFVPLCHNEKTPFLRCRGLNVKSSGVEPIGNRIAGKKINEIVWSVA